MLFGSKNFELTVKSQCLVKNMKKEIGTGKVFHYSKCGKK